MSIFADVGLTNPFPAYGRSAKKSTIFFLGGKARLT